MNYKKVENSAKLKARKRSVYGLLAEPVGFEFTNFRSVCSKTTILGTFSRE